MKTGFTLYGITVPLLSLFILGLCSVSRAESINLSTGSDTQPAVEDLQTPSSEPNAVTRDSISLRPTSTETVLSLDEVLAQVRNHHPKLFSADLERRIAGAKLLEKQGAFDPGISLETEYLRYNDFINRGKASKAFDNEAGIGMLTRSGLRVGAGARYNTGDVKPPLYPTGETGEYYIGAKLPLLRGFRVNEKVVQEMQAELGIPQADAQFQNTRLELLLKAAYTYWDWVASQKQLGLTRSMLDLSEFRWNAVKARTSQGDLPAIDAIEAEQEVQRREGLLAKARREFQKSQYKLALFLWDDDGTPSTLPGPDAVPEVMPDPVPFTTEDLMEGRRLALDNRPEIKALSLEKEVRNLDLDYARNMKLPILDMFATPGYDTGAQSIGPTLKAGVTMVIPLRQRTAKGMIAAAEYKIQKLDMEQRLLLQQILLEVEDSVSAINAAFQQYQAAQRELELAQRLERGERERFDYGDSTLFMVNQRERATLEAGLKVIALAAQYHQAVADYRAVTGQL